MQRILSLLLVLLLAGCAGSQTGDDSAATASQAQGVTSKKAEPVPTETALAHPGDAGDGSIVMVNGRTITPAGQLLPVYNFPTNLLVLPSGDVVESSMRTPGINIVDGTAFAVLGAAATDFAFHGLAANAAGDKLWVSHGAEQTIGEYDVVAGVPTLSRTIPSMLTPAGLALTPDESRLLICNSYGSGLQIVDLTTGVTDQVAPTNLYPYEVLVSADGDEAYVSNWGDSTITVIDVAQGERLADVEVGLHPEGMALSSDGQRLYVANADNDTISVVDVAARELLDTYEVYRSDEFFGASPLDAALSGDDATLYVAAAGLNAVVVFNTATGEQTGMIPTGYYPTAVALDESQSVLYVTNGKGGGIPSAKSKAGVSMNGTLEKIALPTPTELADYTDQVMNNLTRTELYWETMDFESPIPTERGTPSQQIKHVVYIMRENKTFDQVYGDFEGAERDPSNLVFGADYTPNGHNLAGQFTICDNYYSEANVSLQGHMWSILMYSNDYDEKAWAADSSYRYPLANIEPASCGGKGSIFRHLYNNGVEFRAYGQVLTLGDLPDLAPYFNFKYGFWNLGVSDEIKAGEIIREWEAGIWPEFVYISLHNDHSNGSDAGAPTPRYYVGDNDAGLGKLIDYITHSDKWSETAVFILEDDPQSGADHVDPHRSPVIVVSPWAKHGYISSALYSMSSIWMTIEMILGLPPMAVYDEHTSPMYDVFTMTPDYGTYTAVPNPTPLEYNPKGLPLADYSSKQRWDAPDQVRRLGEIVWGTMRPNEPFPAHLSVDSYAEDLDEDEENDADDYVGAVRAMQEYALQRGLWNGEKLPTIREMVEQGLLVPVNK
ncbi:MAG: beta-propeller fold lactonase family protein [Myxococcales bacterium]|nr:beta-propeller fold lactonase family protein [Myxococcales bacterium]